MAKYFNKFISINHFCKTISRLRSPAAIDAAVQNGADVYGEHLSKTSKSHYGSYDLHAWRQCVQTMRKAGAKRLRQIDKRQYVRIDQGFAGEFLSDTHYPDRIRYLDGPEFAPWGSGVYAINPDGSLETYDTNFDTSG
jgi:hypothetical protein